MSVFRCSCSLTENFLGALCSRVEAKDRTQQQFRARPNTAVHRGTAIFTTATPIESTTRNNTNGSIEMSLPGACKSHAHRIADVCDESDDSSDETTWISGLITRLSTKTPSPLRSSQQLMNDDTPSHSTMVKKARRATKEFLLSETEVDKSTFEADADIDFNDVFTESEPVGSTAAAARASNNTIAIPNSTVLNPHTRIQELEDNLLRLECKLIAERAKTDKAEFERDLAIAEAKEYRQQLENIQIRTEHDLSAIHAKNAHLAVDLHRPKMLEPSKDEVTPVSSLIPSQHNNMTAVIAGLLSHHRKQVVEDLRRK
eukprot:m.1645452 g.1645452  ORF g.1645452 m.1645452 type:complete len:315 (-) comp67439_c0_seq1:75-1019(-)